MGSRLVKGNQIISEKEITINNDNNDTINKPYKINNRSIRLENNSVVSLKYKKRKKRKYNNPKYDHSITENTKSDITKERVSIKSKELNAISDNKYRNEVIKSRREKFIANLTKEVDSLRYNIEETPDDTKEYKLDITKNDNIEEENISNEDSIIEEEVNNNIEEENKELGFNLDELEEEESELFRDEYPSEDDASNKESIQEEEVNIEEENINENNKPEPLDDMMKLIGIDEDKYNEVNGIIKEEVNNENKEEEEESIEDFIERTKDYKEEDFRKELSPNKKDDQLFDPETENAIESNSDNDDNISSNEEEYMTEEERKYKEFIDKYEDQPSSEKIKKNNNSDKALG